MRLGLTVARRKRAKRSRSKSMVLRTVTLDKYRALAADARAALRMIRRPSRCTRRQEVCPARKL